MSYCTKSKKKKFKPNIRGKLLIEASVTPFRKSKHLSQQWARATNKFSLAPQPKPRHNIHHLFRRPFIKNKLIGTNPGLDRPIFLSATPTGASYITSSAVRAPLSIKFMKIQSCYFFSLYLVQ